MFLTQNDREAAVEVLSRLPFSAFKRMIPENTLKFVMEAEGRGGQRDRVEMAELLLDLYGTDLLAEYQVRLELCELLHADQLRYLAEKGGLPERARSRTAMFENIAGRKWYAGKAWAMIFATTLGLPLIFGGLETPPAAPATEDVEVFTPPPPLYDYQKTLKDRVLKVLIGESSHQRGLVSLPTGAGKTRVVVEALVEAMGNDRLRAPRILWVAQSDELCEQALESFRNVWRAEGAKGRVMRLHRLWGGHDLVMPAEDSVVVASIQKLYRLATDPDTQEDLKELGDALGAVVIDEAHHAVAPSYTEVLRGLGLATDRRTNGKVPLLGLSATPYRNDEETDRLAKRFQSNLLTPWALDVNPVERLQTDHILSVITHDVVPTGAKMRLTEKEKETLKTFNEFPDSFVKRLGGLPDRNRKILERMLAIESDWPVLFFGCSREHASTMAVLLRRRGITAAVVTAETSRSARRAIVEDFKAGRIRVLCNYGIFTTGFDAPRVRAVVVARPTASVVLYEQMIGRGLRGPRSGGTAECLIVDFGDNLERFGVPLAYTRFSDYWQRSRRTGGRKAEGEGTA